jgi:hypothetical protein
VVAKGREPEHFDFFFDLSSTQRKDFVTGGYMLGELLDSARNPIPGSTKSIFSSIVLSGDTGNGFRGYEMLEYLSHAHANFGFHMRLIPLPPAHAFNLTDQRFAHINTFVDKLLRYTRVFGAEGIAAQVREASTDRTQARKYIARSHVFFREVPLVDPGTRAGAKKLIGALLHHSQVREGKCGVRGLLYFDFMFPDGSYHPGHAHVSEYFDKSVKPFGLMVYTWRKRETRKMCQACSDRVV